MIDKINNIEIAFNADHSRAMVEAFFKDLDEILIKHTMMAKVDAYYTQRDENPLLTTYEKVKLNGNEPTGKADTESKPDIQES